MFFLFTMICVINRGRSAVALNFSGFLQVIVFFFQMVNSSVTDEGKFIRSYMNIYSNKV